MFPCIIFTCPKCPVEPETIFKAFDDLISYLESIGPENVHDASVISKETSEFANTTQLRKVGELISTKLITRVVDSCGKQVSSKNSIRF